jgi:hypothetical protein
MLYDMHKMIEMLTARQLLIKDPHNEFKNNLSNGFGADTRSQRERHVLRQIFAETFNTKYYQNKSNASRVM